MKAILVEDEYMLQKSFKRLSSGIKDFELMEIFDNADEAFDYLKDNEIDTAFIDIYLPGVDGFQLVRSLKELKPTLGLVFVTGSLVNKNDCEKYGVDDILLKPYSREMLEEVINGLNEKKLRQMECRNQNIKEIL